MQRRLFLLAILAALATTGTAADRDVTCVRLDNRIADLRLKLRLGYSAKQGRVMRQKLAALEAERRVQCR
jgi:hypothetical protein